MDLMFNILIGVFCILTIVCGIALIICVFEVIRTMIFDLNGDTYERKKNKKIKEKKTKLKLSKEYKNIKRQ